MGEMLTIEIRAELINENPQPQIHITHIDSGTGFDEKASELIIIFLIIRKYVKTGTASGSITLHPVSVLP